jgi:hypothetical protein
MIELILQKAATAVHDDVAAVTLSGGAAQVLQLTSGKSVKRIPAVPLAPGEEPRRKGDTYKDLIPTDQESAVVFFQTMGSSQVAEDARKSIHLARARMVLWGNKRRLDPPNLDALLAECIAVVRTADLTEEYLSPVRAFLEYIEPKDKAIFSPYTFDEAATQYLSEPYDFRSCVLEFRYVVLTSCLPTVSPVIPTC